MKLSIVLAQPFLLTKGATSERRVREDSIISQSSNQYESGVDSHTLPLTNNKIIWMTLTENLDIIWYGRQGLKV